MAYQTNVLRRAKRDISAAAAWYLERSADPEVAESWLLGIENAIDSLGLNPERGSIARESDAFDETLRELFYGSGRRKTHRIVYRIIEDDDCVEVLAVRHFAQRDLTPDDVP